MMTLLFEYHTTSVGSWDKKWSGTGKVFAKLKTISKEKRKIGKDGLCDSKRKEIFFSL